MKTRIVSRLRTRLSAMLRPVTARAGAQPPFTPDPRWAPLPFGCTLTYNKYGAYCVPESSAHRPAAMKILAHDVWEPDTIQFMRERCGDGDVIHAGTFFGDFLPALSTAVHTDARVLAFEPVAENHRCAQLTIALNSIQNVSLTHAGVGTSTTSLRMRTIGPNGISLGGSSRIVSHNQEGDESVNIVRIDDCVRPQRRVSIIQLDVEGHEQQALEGALETIRRWRPILILEQNPGDAMTSGEWFNTNILTLGYVCAGEIQGNQLYLASANN